MESTGISRRAALLLTTASASAIACAFRAADRARSVVGPGAPLAATNAGVVRGYFDRGIAAFKGIPYGADTARRRFEAPAAPASWQGVRNCVAFGPAAPQLDRTALPSSEDCLRLNVWTPALRDAGRRPVLVYFHGGGYSNGSVNDDSLDGVNLCRRGDVVVVTVNHRLNGFGYLSLADLGAPRYAASGVAGQLDLILALTWVRDNIGEFGGDPACVTIFGQSGGGAKCATLMAMPAARGLFHRVWTMSGQQLTGRTREHAMESARLVLGRLGVASKGLSALERLPQASLSKAFADINWTPVVDGAALPRDPFAPDASPLSSHIPMVMGNTREETANLIGAKDPEIFQLAWGTLPAKLVHHVGQFMRELAVEEVVAAYRRWYPGYTPTDVFIAASTAARSWKSFVLQAERRTQQGRRTFAYYLHWRSPLDGGKWRSPHMLDIPLVFDNVFAHELTRTGGGAAQAVADAMSTALLAFARTGTPSVPSRTAWPPYELPARPAMVFDATPRIEHDSRGNERELFAPASYVQPGT